MMFNMVLLIVLCYLLGSIPFGYIIVKLTKGVDVRQLGSHSTGATNVLRASGKTASVVVLLLDVFKGYLAVGLANYFTLSPGTVDLAKIIAAFSVIIGHSWPVFLNFRGGKSVATGFGAFLGIMPVPAIISLAVFIIIVAITGFVSLGSIIAVSLMPVYCISYGKQPSFILIALIIALVIIIRHKNNIKRLISGTENKIGNRN